MTSFDKTGSPVKIAILLPSLQVGGAERLVLEELTCLKDDPRFLFEVHLVFDKGPLFEHVACLGVQVHVWNAPHKSLSMLITYVKIILHLRKSNCDILHSHLLDKIGPIVGKLSGVKVVSTVHSDKNYGFAERFALSKSDLVLGCAERVLRNISRFVPHGKVFVLSNAVQAPENSYEYSEDMLGCFGIKKGSKVVVSFGRFKKVKGFDVLIEAFRRVVIEVPDAILLIGGEGEEKKCLDDLVETSGLGKNIKLPGLIVNINEVLSVCDLYVNSSRWEGLPMTLLEAMAHGKPMIATNVGGNPEVVHDDVTGILVPPDDPQKLAEAIVKMLKDANYRESAGNAAFTLFNSKYTIDKHCESLAEFYLQVLKK